MSPAKPKDIKEQAILEELGEKGLEEFRRFRDKERQRQTRIELETRTSEILEGDLREENEKAIEILNSVYRKAWKRSCKELGYEESEFPSKY